ncbi:MAG: YajG family lipoprotein [Pseudomonadota bacterium]
MIRCVKPVMLAGCFTLLLSACQSAPDPLLIAPVSIADQLSTKVADIKVQDQRTHAYLYRVKRKQDQAQFAPPQQPLTDIITESLQSLVTDKGSNNGLKWYVSLEQGLVEATLSGLKYQLEHTIVIRVQAQRANRSYSNSYRGRLQSNGVGRPDEAVIEREFTQLLQSVLSDISKDPKLRINQQENN